MAIDKPFSDISDQILIQKRRGLKVKDDVLFTKKLMELNYFDLINGFETIFLRDEVDKAKGYYPNVSLSDFISIYELDTCLNKEIMNSLRAFEIKLKTQIAYHFSKRYCNGIFNTINYLDKSYYMLPNLNSYNYQYLASQYNNAFNCFAFFQQYDVNGRKVSVGVKTYVDIKKENVKYIDRYNQPPLWVIIKQLMFREMFVMTGLLKPNVIRDVLRSFNLQSGDRDYFLNCIDVFRELRNDCAHFELINRFRTTSKTNLKHIGYKHSITPGLSNANGDMYRIKLFDTLLILSHFVDVSNVIKHIVKYRRRNLILGKSKVTHNLLDRMGCTDIKRWESLQNRKRY